MTNDKTVTMSRELAELLANGDLLGTRISDARQELRALLVAPVVERQPIGRVSYIGNGFIRARCIAPPPLETLIYTAPPELQTENDNLRLQCGGMEMDIAELQATIARLETQVANALNLDFERRETIARMTAENERLKGGQGEAVAWIKPDVLATLRKDECCYAFGDQSPKGNLVPLYTSQPAPVSVTSDAASDRAYRNGLQQGYNLALNGSEKEFQDAISRYSTHEE